MLFVSPPPQHNSTTYNLIPYYPNHDRIIENLKAVYIVQSCDQAVKYIVADTTRVFHVRVYCTQYCKTQGIDTAIIHTGLTQVTWIIYQYIT